MLNGNNKYSIMQKNQYEHEASLWSLNNKDYVVGSFDYHNNWQDYNNFLFKDIGDLQSKTALDFGCGPGRNIVKFAPIFKQIDGVDISNNNLEKALTWFNHNNLQMKPKLFVNNGVDLSSITDNFYDVVFSTICLQHICVHEIRFSLFKEFFRVLKDGGYFCAQMGFGARNNSCDYYDNNYNAIGTNGICDTRVDNPDQLKNDLEKIGYKNFSYDIRPVGPGDQHKNWIFFRALKN